MSRDPIRISVDKSLCLTGLMRARLTERFERRS
jgi:hypothetical protein